MALQTSCPECDAPLNIPREFEGKRIKCKKCGEAFVACRADEDDDDEETPPRKTLKSKSVPPPAKSRKDDDDVPPNRPASRKSSKTSKRSDDDEEDDEPKPRKKKQGTGKGKAKKKEGSPIMLILIGVGALVLLGGGGVGAYFAFFDKEKQPDGQQGKGLGTTGSAKAEADPTAGWVDVNDDVARYRIKFPGKPEITSMEWQKERGVRYVVKTFKWKTNTEEFQCSFNYLPVDRMGKSDQQILDERTAGSREGAHGDKVITHQGFNGREWSFKVAAAKQGETFRAFIAGDRIIFLSVSSEKYLPNEPRVKGFFDSLKIEQ